MFLKFFADPQTGDKFDVKSILVWELWRKIYLSITNAWAYCKISQD